MCDLTPTGLFYYTFAGVEGALLAVVLGVVALAIMGFIEQ